jgi:hypothetical protein
VKVQLDDEGSLRECEVEELSVGRLCRVTDAGRVFTTPPAMEHITSGAYRSLQPSDNHRAPELSNTKCGSRQQQLQMHTLFISNVAYSLP